jgi:hypothetical protein
MRAPFPPTTTPTHPLRLFLLDWGSHSLGTWGHLGREICLGSRNLCNPRAEERCTGKERLGVWDGQICYKICYKIEV